MANVPAVVDPNRPSWLNKYIAADAATANAEYVVPGGVPIGVISIKGKVWAAKYQGETTKLMIDGFPAPFFDAIIAGANPASSKTFYLDPFNEGSVVPPDCASDDGLKPLPNVPHRQNDVCVSCKHNVFGTGLAQGGGNTKGKRCQDNKRLAVLPDGDVVNEAFGGPMLLRLAPTSRTLFKDYVDEQSAAGRPLHAIVTRMSFDPDVSGVTIKFQFRGWVDEEDDLAQIVKWRSDDLIARVLGTEHPPEHRPDDAGPQQSEAAQADPKPKLNGNGAAADMEKAVSQAEAAVTKPKPAVVETKPIEPPKPKAPPKPTAEEIKAARIAKIKADMEAELLALEGSAAATEEPTGEVDDTDEVLAMLDNIAKE
jgi:hypothetical protein